MVSYEVIESIVRHVVNNLDPKASFGRPRTYDICKVWNRIQRMLRSSQPWSMMEEPDLSHKTLHRIFIRWCRLGVFQKIHSVILKLYRMKHPLKSDRYYATDTTFVKNIYGTQTIGRNPTDRGRSATKLSVIVNQEGCVSNLVMFPANVSDQRVLQRTLDRAQLRRGVAMHADKGYDSASNRKPVATERVAGPHLQTRSEKVQKCGKKAHCGRAFFWKVEAAQAHTQQVR